jgi:hypothetical protein
MQFPSQISIAITSGRFQELFCIILIVSGQNLPSRLKGGDENSDLFPIKSRVGHEAIKHFILAALCCLEMEPSN